MKNIILIALSIFIIFNDAHSAPTISTVTGTVSDGESVDVTGLAFGVNPLTHEFIKDNIEAGTPGDVFAETSWSTTTDTTIAYSVRYSNEESHSGNNSVVAKFENSVTQHYLSRISYSQGAIPHSTTMFVSFWLKPAIETTGEDSMQLKLWRMRPTADQVSSETQFAQSLWYDSNTPVWTTSGTGFRITSTPATRAACTAFIQTVGEFPTINAWSKMDYSITKNSALGESDGGYKNWINQALVLNESSCETHDATSEDWLYSVFGYEFSNGDATPYSALIYMDDIYIAYTPARFVIGDNADWESCTHREIQDATAWTTTTGSFAVNTGSFEPGIAYLFAIDDAGDASAGYAITFGAGSSTSTGITISAGCTIN